MGDTVEIMMPDREPFSYTVNKLWDENDTEIESAPHPMQIFKLDIGIELPEFSMLRKKTNGGM